MTQEENTYPKDLPEMHDVESTNIKAAGYDAANMRAIISFKGGGLWRYYDVPAATFTEMVQSESVGGYFHAKIKGKYDSEEWMFSEGVWSGKLASRHQEHTSQEPAAEVPSQDGKEQAE